MEELAGAPIFGGAYDQHEAFHDPMMRLKAYVEFHLRSSSDLQTYRWSDMKLIIDEMGAPLYQHLQDEIPMLLSLTTLDSDKLWVTFKKAEDVAKAGGKISFLYEIFPMVLGTCDKTFQGGKCLSATARRDHVFGSLCVQLVL